MKRKNSDQILLYLPYKYLFIRFTKSLLVKVKYYSNKSQM
jgi:hypothetical protein